MLNVAKIETHLCDKTLGPWKVTVVFQLFSFSHFFPAPSSFHDAVQALQGCPSRDQQCPLQ